MIRGCPGRYVLRGRRSRPARVAGALATALDTRALLAAALGEQTASGVCVWQLRSARCADVVAVAVLVDGGGVLTYCKRGGGESAIGADDGDVVHVHTLNTASGLQRKLEGLGLDHVLRLAPSVEGVNGLAEEGDKSAKKVESIEGSHDAMQLQQQESADEVDEGSSKTSGENGDVVAQLQHESAVDTA